MLDCQKHAFSLPDGAHYLNGAYMSPLPKRVEAAGLAAVVRKRFPMDVSTRDFFAGADEARRLFAGLVGSAEPERVAILPAVSYGISVAARNTPVSPGQNIIMAEGQFPSNALPWRRLARESGAELRVVAAPAEVRGRSRSWSARLLEAIDADTAVVALAPVHWTDGTVFDLVSIGARAREQGAAFVVDGTQLVGAAPFDVEVVRPDALVCAAYKWLLGPYSVGFGWFGPRYDGGTPLEETWLAREGSEDFRNLVAYNDAYRPAAARYDVGGRSNFALMPMAIAALEQVTAWSPAAIEAYCRALTADLFAAVPELGFEADEEAGRAAHLFGLRATGALDNEEVRAALEQRSVYVSLRGSAVRVSPNVYNDADDIAALRDALAAAV